MQAWQLQEAKARLSELVKQARSDGAQVITVHNQPAVVVVSFRKYQELVEPRESFLELMESSPLYGAELDLEREDSAPRDVDLE